MIYEGLLAVSFLAGFFLAQRLERHKAKVLLHYAEWDMDDDDEYRAEDAQGVVAKYKGTAR